MKKHIRLLSSLSLFLVLSAPVYSIAASGNEIGERKKLINKSYTVKASDQLEIDNQFGNVAVSTWDKDEITVDIEIVARGATDEKAQQVMDQIEVKDWKEGHTIGFKTKVGEIQGNNSNSRNNRGDNYRSFYIDYIIHMPGGNRLSVTNTFGKIEVPDFKGAVTLSSKFGSLNTGKLDNVDAISVDFGRAYITEVSNGKVALNYNSEVRIAKISGNVKINSENSRNVQLNVADNVQELSLFESYSGIRLVVSKTLSAEFEVHTSFGNFRNESEYTISERKEDQPDYGPHFDKDYAGKAGEGKARIRIKSSFGNIRLSYANANGDDNDDYKDKDKNKEKNKAKRARVTVI